jgi:RHS repeat-associated protein
MTGSGFKITPGDLHQSGSTLQGFGDQVAQGGDKLQTLGQHLVSHAGNDRSGVGAVIAKALGTGTEVAGKVFSEGGRVAGAAGKRLHGNASAHESNESGVSKSFQDLHDPKSTTKSPKAAEGANGKPSTNGGKDYHEPTKSPKSVGATGKGNTTPAADRTYCGDPIDVSTGRMVLTQTDVELAGMLRLVLSRTHVSGYQLGRWFGASWASTVDQRLAVDDDGVHLVVEDGRVLSYPAGAVLPEAGARWPLRPIENGYVVTDPDAERRYYFTGDGLPLRGIADGDGNQIDLVYDTTGTLTELRHSGGYRVTVQTTDGLITALRLHGTTLVEYRYDEERQLTEVVNSSGSPMRFAYDAGRIVRWEDRNGMWYGYHFDERGRCVRAEGAGGYLNISLAYENLVTHATNSLGHTTSYRLNEQLQVVGETDPLGNTTHFEWDPHDRLLARTDPLGRTTRYDYDEAGHVTEVTRPDGTKALAQYNEQGRQVAMVGPDGAVWRREYDPAGKLRRETDPTGATTDYAYDATGAIAAITDALGNITRYESNAIGLPLTVTDPLGAVLRYEYDPSGRVRSVTDPLGAVTRLVWTVDGALGERIDPDGTVWRWDYDGEGNNVETVDAVDGRTRTEYAHFDLPVAETGPDGSRLAYAYDTELRLVSVTNAQGLVWRYEYDPAGNLVGETDFNGRVLRYEYDAAGQLVGQVTGAGERITIERDALGRVVRRDDAVFGYDPAGRLVLARNADAEVTLDYDAAGRVVGEAVNRRTVRSEFDPLGRRIRLVTPAGRESVWEYDAADRPTLLRTPGRVQRFGWDPAGRQVSRELGGAVVRQSWDVNDRLRAQTVVAGDRVLQERGYGYRPDGFLSSVADSLSGARQLDVDAAGRVTAVRGNGWQEQYGYDPAGNLAMAGWPAQAAAAGPRRYAGTLLVAAGDLRYQHDQEGRIVLRTTPAETWRYQWNADSRLVGVSTPDGHTWRYRYDALGRRVAKQRFDGDGRLLEQVDFTWDGAELVEQAHGGPGRRPIVTAWDWEPGADRPVSQAERPLGGSGERSHAIVTDVVGSPAELVDDNGNLAWHAHASLWGVTLSGNGYTPLRFPGQYHDRETGLHYNLHRYYDPEIGRYLTHDPLGLAEGPDTMVYVGNPTEWIDPLGLAKCATASASGAGGGGGGKKPPGRFTPYSKPVIGKSNRKRKYRLGSHGAKKTEQQRLGQEFGTKVSGATHESEHPIGYEVLGNRTGVPRGTSGQASSVENHAPAYQEAEPAHSGHIGTGTRVHPQAVGTSAFGSSEQYRQHQWNALNDTAEGGRNNVSNAVQLNQLDYAHQQSFHNTTGTQAGQIADNSFHHMVDQHVGHGVGFATAPGTTTHTHPVDNTAAAEMHLGRDTIRDQQYPTEEQRSDALYPPPTQAQRDTQAAADGFPPGTYDPPTHNDPMDVDGE